MFIISLCSAYDVEDKVREEIANCISSIVKTGLVHCTALTRLLAEVLIHLTDVNQDTSFHFRKMILQFPADIFARYAVILTNNTGSIKQP